MKNIEKQAEPTSRNIARLQCLKIVKELERIRKALDCKSFSESQAYQCMTDLSEIIRNIRWLPR